MEKTLESPLNCKEIQPVHPKGDQSWVFIGGTDAEAETPILWPPDVKNWLIWKGPDAGKHWGQEEKGMTEDEMVGWHHWLDGDGFGWTVGVCDGQGGLACCSSWGCKELDMTEWLNWTELNWTNPIGLIFLFLKTEKFRRETYTQGERYVGWSVCKSNDVKDCQQTTRNEESIMDQNLPHHPWGKPNLPTSWCWASVLQNHEILMFKLLSLWYFGMAALGN